MAENEGDMMLPENLLEISAYDGPGYQPLVDFGAWRVAVLCYHPELLPENITTMQRHDETDEVFVLLAGRCLLYLAEGSDSITALHAHPMEPLKLYNVKRGAWHSHSLSEDATVLIVENCDTTLANSPVIDLTAEQQTALQALAAPYFAA